MQGGRKERRDNGYNLLQEKFRFDIRKIIFLEKEVRHQNRLHREVMELVLGVFRKKLLNIIINISLHSILFCTIPIHNKNKMVHSLVEGWKGESRRRKRKIGLWAGLCWNLPWCKENIVANQYNLCIEEWKNELRSEFLNIVFQVSETNFMFIKISK